MRPLMTELAGAEQARASVGELGVSCSRGQTWPLGVDRGVRTAGTAGGRRRPARATCSTNAGDLRAGEAARARWAGSSASRLVVLVGRRSSSARRARCGRRSSSTPTAIVPTDPLELDRAASASSSGRDVGLVDGGRSASSVAEVLGQRRDLLLLALDRRPSAVAVGLEVEDALAGLADGARGEAAGSSSGGRSDVAHRRAPAPVEVVAGGVDGQHDRAAVGV